MSKEHSTRILCVDDEPRVLEGLVVHLRREYDVQVATNGEEALAKLKEPGGFALVCSDMRMPGMDGATLLHKVMQLYPEITRVLLTGESGRDVAVNAVNEGQIFRFLTKPCSPERLKTAIGAGVDQHRLVSAERVLLQQTLVGCIRALIDILAMTSPVAFGRASRVKRMAMDLAEQLGYTDFWQLEAAAMLSQIGYLSLAPELVEKLYFGRKLTEHEQTLSESVPAVASKLLGHVPRLEPVLQILSGVHRSPSESSREERIAHGARILGLVLDYDVLMTQGSLPEVAIRTLRRNGRHASPLVDQLAELLGTALGDGEIRQLPLRRVRPGMTLMDDLRTEFGMLLVPRGFEVSESFVERMTNFAAAIQDELVRVQIPVNAAPPVISD